MADVTIGRDARGEFVTFEGRTFWGLMPAGTPATLRALADDNEARATELLFKARMARAVADVKEERATVEAERKAAQRRERAAATRAHNRDPFGFNARLNA